MFNYLVAANAVVRAMEAIHHPIHVCARVPVTAAQCAPEDQALELEIQSFHVLTYETATMMWAKSFTSALAHLHAEGVVLRNWRRLSLNLKGSRCPICGMEPFWEVDIPADGLAGSYLRAMSSVPIDVTIRLRGKTLLSSERWNYFLEPGEVVL